MYQRVKHSIQAHQVRDVFLWDQAVTADGAAGEAFFNFRADAEGGGQFFASARARFVKEDGIIEGWGKLAVKLLEGFIDLSNVEHGYCALLPLDSLLVRSQTVIGPKPRSEDTIAGGSGTRVARTGQQRRKGDRR